MDLNPLIPNTTTSHDVAHIISESFEHTIRNYLLPNDVTENLRKNNVDKEYALFQQFGNEVKKYADIVAEKHESLRSLETKIMKKHAMGLILENNIEEDKHIKEEILLKRDGFFTSHEFDVKNINLIDKIDILPNKVEQSLEFVHQKDLHGCKFKHCEKVGKKNEEETRKLKEKLENEKSRTYDLEMKNEEKCSDELLRLDPKEILFDDFELNTTYKKKVRVQNCSQRKRPFFFKFPLKSPFSLKPLSNAQFLAPGMYVDFYVTYCAKIYHNYSVDIEFSTSGGYKTVLKVRSFRKPPHLRVYLFRSLGHILRDKCPGDKEFWEKRCTALNDTIDCGHCFIGNYNYLSLLVGNAGCRGQFFLLTEDEWISGNVNTIDNTLQFTKECFKIFPSYITVEKEEVAEICVTFSPITSGLHVEKLYFISDNNTAKTVEIIGDGLYFSKSMVQLHLKSRHFENVAKICDETSVNVKLEGKESVYLGHVANLSSNKLTFTVDNKSAVLLNFYWTFRENEEDIKSHFLEPKNIHIKTQNYTSLSPYTTYDFDVDIIPEVDQEGHYCVIVGFFIEKIPAKALKEDEDFTVHCDEVDTNFLDVQLSEVVLGCEVYFENVEMKPEKPPQKMCACPRPPSPTETDNLKFSTDLLDIGIIPIGIELTRNVCICNMTNQNVEWIIREIIYDVDMKPSMYVSRNPSVDETSGTITGEKHSLQYFIAARKPIRWVSMLLLFTKSPNGDLELNDSCMITYEVIDWDIRIYSEVSNFPIVCSLKLHYVGERYQWNFFIKNHTPILGCFWLLQPVGTEADKMELTFHPKCGLIRPGEKIKVVVDVVPKETGIIEDILVPCVISRTSPPIMIRILAAIDDVNVYFYIPSQAEGYDKILWPPKILNEVDFQELKSAERLCSECEEESDYVYACEDEGKAENSESEIVLCTQSELSAAQSYKSSDSTTVTQVPGSGSTSHIISLVEFLKERCSHDFIKQDYAVEIRNVPLNKPEKFSFFIENVTPVEANFSIETTNFQPCIDTETSIVNSIALIYPDTIHSTWKKACAKHGIVIVVDIEKGTLKFSDVIQVNVWIYATTWGIYTEEIVVNINNITPFYFNVFVEVDGLPISFPIAKNTIREYATLRFGHIPYMTETVTRTLHLKNTSCLPLIIQWFLFDASKKTDESQPFNVMLDVVKEDYRSTDGEIRLFLSEKNFGEQDISFLQVMPTITELEPYENSFVEVKINPNHFPVNFQATNLICYLIGYIFVKEEHKNQPNLVYRVSGEDLKPLQVEILSTIVMPLLKLELICGKPRVNVEAIDVIESEKQSEKMKLLFQNSNLTSVFVNFHVDSPFSILNISMREYEFVEIKNNAVIKPGDVVEVELNCSLETDDVIQMGEWLYNKDLTDKEKRIDPKVTTLCRQLNIHQRGVLEQSVPIYCDISYPRIDVNPPFLKFGHVKIGCTKKLYLHLFNMTNRPITFEIEKSINLPEFVVKPETGVIEKAVGSTRSFFDVCVYFTPILYNFYQESILITTKIPQCYLEVPMNGYGIQNEKFDVNPFTFQP